MPLKGCRRKSQRAEIKFLTAVDRFRIGGKITNDNITIQLKVKTVHVMVKYQRNKASNVTMRCVCVTVISTEKLISIKYYVRVCVCLCACVCVHVHVCVRTCEHVCACAHSS